MESTKTTNENTQKVEIDLRKLIAILLDGKNIILSFTFIFFLLSIVYILNAIPIYKANSIILVEDSAPGIPGLDDMTEIFSSESSSATELQVINSRFVIGSVVDELDLTIHIEQDRALPLGKVTNTSPYQSIGIPFFEIPKNNFGDEYYIIIEDDLKFSLWFDGQKVLNSSVGNTAQSRDGSVEILIDKMNAPVGSKFKLFKKNRLDVILELQDRLRVFERGKDSGIIELSIEGSDQNRITNILNSISANYVLR